MDASTFWNRNAARYAASPVDDVPAYEAKLARLRELLSSDSNVLEMGCGTGSTAIAMASHVKSWTGSDISSEMIRIAEAKSSPENVRFVHAGATTTVDGGPFDAICAFSLLHLVPDLGEVLDNVKTQVKPGGLVICKSICIGDMSVFFRALVRVVQLVKGVPHLKALKLDDVVKQIEQRGFEIVEVRLFSETSNSPFIVARLPLD